MPSTNCRYYARAPLLKSIRARAALQDEPFRTSLVAMPKTKNPHAVALGRKGGKKGGKARWEGVSAEQRRAHAKKAAAARWKKKPKSA